MSYTTIINIAESPSLQRRVQAAVAKEAAAAEVSIPYLATWVADRMLHIAATSGWDQKWEYYEASYTPIYNPDVGARPDVVTDEDILAAIQPLVLALKPVDPPPAE